MHEVTELLDDILEAITDIQEIHEQGKDAFLEPRILQTDVSDGQPLGEGQE
ncbi:MAG: hypothetical protein ACR2M0_10650 [Chloroflexia bacterium]